MEKGYAFHFSIVAYLAPRDRQLFILELVWRFYNLKISKQALRKLKI